MIKRLENNQTEPVPQIDQSAFADDVIYDPVVVQSRVLRAGKSVHHDAEPIRHYRKQWRNLIEIKIKPFIFNKLIAYLNKA